MKKNKPNISIIIPLYNGEKYIKTCIDSILNQTYKDYEIIVINDGSKDNSRTIVENIDDERIKLINIENHGVSYARNLGIEKALGNYIMFIDADDYIESNALQILMEAFEKNDVDIIRYNGYEQHMSKKFSELEFPVENGTILESKKDSERIIDIFNKPGQSIRGYSWLVILKNDNIIKFNCNLSYLEDKLFCMENFLNDKKILFLNKKIYYYIYNTNSKTKKKEIFLQNMLDILDSKDYIDELVEKYEYKKSYIIKASYGLLLLYRIDYMVKGSTYKESIETLKQLLENNRINQSLDFTDKTMNKFKRIQLWLLKKHMLKTFCFATKIKENIKNIIK